MITYKNIGHFGRLGNQMFQFAAAYGIAKKNAYDVCFPKGNTTSPSVESFKDGVVREVYFDIPKVFKIDENLMCDDVTNGLQYEVQEPHFHFTDQLFSIPDNCNLNGYYQTEKYFEHCSEDIKRLFTFEDYVASLASVSMDILDKSKSKISIHVRLGDYVNMQQFHTVLGSDYYQKALEHFYPYEDYQFLVFSDNIDQCKNIFPDNFHFVEEGNDYVEMCMMSMCDHNIIANSSFSWWAAWLNKNPNKKVIAPNNWFGPAYNHDTKDLYCKNWIVI